MQVGWGHLQSDIEGSDGMLCFNDGVDTWAGDEIS